MTEPMHIPLGRGLFALVDESDYFRLKHRRYYAKRCRNKVYAARQGTQGPPTRSGQRNFVPLSRDVLGAKQGARVRHLNGDTLDCRRENLRVEAGQAYRMTHVQRKPYAARIRHGAERFFLGTYPRREWAEAAAHTAKQRLTELRGVDLSARELRRELDLAVGREV